MVRLLIFLDERLHFYNLYQFTAVNGLDFFAFQDVSAKIMSFSQHGTRAVCILSANGTVSNVTLRQSATSGGTVTYEVCIFNCHHKLSVHLIQIASSSTLRQV